MFFRLTLTGVELGCFCSSYFLELSFFQKPHIHLKIPTPTLASKSGASPCVIGPPSRTVSPGYCKVGEQVQYFPLFWLFRGFQKDTFDVLLGCARTISLLPCWVSKIRKMPENRGTGFSFILFRSEISGSLCILKFGEDGHREMINIRNRCRSLTPMRGIWKRARQWFNTSTGNRGWA